MLSGISSEKRNAAQKKTQERVLVELPVEAIRPNPYQPRQRFDEEELDGLKQSIAEAGLIQPLVVRALAGRYELIAGERRLRACKLLGMDRVLCVVQRCEAEEDSALMALIENVQRRDLHFFEEAECYRAVLRTYRMTQETLAKKLGKTQSFLANKLRLLQFSPDLRRKMTEANLSERHVRALLRLGDDRLSEELTARIAEKHMTVKEVERLIERILTSAQAPKKPRLLRLLKDYRLFVNSVKVGAEQLRDTGLAVELIQTDFEDGVDMLVRVRRSQPDRPAASGNAQS